MTTQNHEGAFAVDMAGLAEIEGGRDPHRLAFEPVTNVFDEYRGYGDPGRRRPTYCEVEVQQVRDTRSRMYLKVRDDGAGFDRAEDIWTLFAHTPKRVETGVSGRFNTGEKQLLAVAKSASIETVVDGRLVTVRFDPQEPNGRSVTRHRGASPRPGTWVIALMPWSVAEAQRVRIALAQMVPPEGLRYTVDGTVVTPPPKTTAVSVTMPTVTLIDGVLRPTERKTIVEVYPETMGVPWLFELGVPVCSIEDSEFPHSLNVMQKVPLGMGRDSVTPAYLSRLIGSVVEAAALDGTILLDEAAADAPHLKKSLDWVRRPEALGPVVEAVFPDAVRTSSDAGSNAMAAASGKLLISGRAFTEATRRRIDSVGSLPTSRQVFGEQVDSARQTVGEMFGGGGSSEQATCPQCGTKFTP
jgi:hypothetical protein